MYHVSTPVLVRAARRAGIIAALPRANAPDFASFDRWLAEIMEDQPPASSPPMAVNLSTRLPLEEMTRNLALCRRRGVELIISATGDPRTLIQGARDHGMVVFSDAVNLRFAEKSIQAGAQGIIAIGAGGGGHSGGINHLTLVSAIRSGFDGTIVMAGAVGDGRALRAAEVLGADMAYMGTRFIATEESGAPDDYKRMLVRSGVDDVLYTAAINGVHANWLKPSLRERGLDPDRLPVRPDGARGHAHLPPDTVPWRNLWSAGQGVQQIDAILPVAGLLDDVEREYRLACATPPFASR